MPMCTVLFMKNSFLNITSVTQSWINATLSELYVIPILAIVHDELREQLESKIPYKTFIRLRRLKYSLLGNLDTMRPYILTTRSQPL